METISEKKPRFFFGWWIIAGCLVMSIAHGGLGPYSFGVFLRPLTEEFGWLRGPSPVLPWMSLALLVEASGHYSPRGARGRAV